MSKFRNYFFVILGIMVLVRWFMLLPRLIIAGPYLTTWTPAANSGKSLPEINFAEFSGKIKPGYISQGYGGTWFALISYAGRWHNGIDIVANWGAPVYSATDGKVIAAGDQDEYCWRHGFGKFVLIKNSSDNKVLFYAHLSKILTAQEREVKRGDKIGLVGNTGFATAPHLHFSVFDASGFTIMQKNGCGPNPDGDDINPVPYLEKLK